MKRLLALLLLLPVLAIAQYAPPIAGSSGASVPFWAAGPTSLLSASGTSARVALSTTNAGLAGQVQVYNATTAIAFVACGNVAIAATVGSAGAATGSYPVAPGSVVVISKPTGALYCAAILSTSTGSVYFTPGGGL